MTSYRVRLLASVVPVLFPLLPLHADVTVRYKTVVQLNPLLPPSMAGAMKAVDRLVPQESVLRFKGGKGFSTSTSTSSSSFTSITDFTNQEITLLDVAGKRYAKMTSDRFGEELERAVPVPATSRTAASSMKTEATPARLTGRTDVIQGVEAEEREFAISLEMPALPNVPPGPMMRMVLQFWTAKPGEVMRTPAIRELAGYSLWAHATMNPAAGIVKMIKQLQGVSGMLESMTKEMQNGTVLRMHMDIFMPGLAALQQRSSAESGQPSGGFDPNAPFMQMTQEVAELSTASVPDEVFQIPADCQEVAPAELIKAMVAKSQDAVKQ